MDFSLLLILLLIVAILLRVDFIFYFLYVSVGIYLWSRWHSPYALRHLRSSRRSQSHAFWGEILTVTLQIENLSRLPIPWLQLHESTAVHLRSGQRLRQAISLKGRERHDLTYTVQARKRGYYRLGPTLITLGDIFGFRPSLTKSVPADFLTVYPRIFSMSQLSLPSQLPFGALSGQRRLFTDPARLMGSREFQSGDSIRQINWKLTSHTRQLMVKTFEPAISLETAILLNLHESDYQRQNRRVYIERAIEIAASVAAHLIQRKQAVGLATNGLDPLAGHAAESLRFDKETGRLVQSTNTPLPDLPMIPPRSGRPNLMKILERLARLEMATTLPFHTWLSTTGAQLNWGTFVLAITAKGDAFICHSLHQFVRAGLHPVLIVVEPDANFSQVKERARQLGFSAYLAPPNQTLSEIGRPLPWVTTR